MLNRVAAHSCFVMLLLTAASSGAQSQVAVTPDNESVAAPSNASGQTAFFWLRNLAPGPVTYYLSCSRSGAVTSCSLGTSTYPNVPSGASVPVQPTFSTGLAGSGTLLLKACDNPGCTGPNWDTGSFNVGVQDFMVSVTPDSATGAVEPTRRANTGGDTAVFTVRNAGVLLDSYSLTCAATGSVVCGTVSPNTLTNLAPGASATVKVNNYSVGAAGTGTLRLTATGTYSSDAGSYTVPVATAGGPL